MKAKHIISAILILTLPFVIIFGFGALGNYLNLMGRRYFILWYGILSTITSSVPIAAYIFWLSFVMRTNYRPARILFCCCSFAVAVFLFFSYIGYWVIPIPMNNRFVSTPTFICALANQFAGVYMLIKVRQEK